MELNNLGFMNNNDMDYIYNIMLNQQESILQKFVKEKLKKNILKKSFIILKLKILSFKRMKYLILI